MCYTVHYSVTIHTYTFHLRGNANSSVLTRNVCVCVCVYERAYYLQTDDNKIKSVRKLSKHHWEIKKNKKTLAFVVIET